MVEFIVGFCAGVLICVGAGFLIWRNNRAKWGKMVDQMLALVDEYKDVNALKAAVQNLLSKIR
jgi:hypothetical protein